MATTLSLLPEELTIEVVQGTDNPIEFTLSRKLADGTVQPINIANDTIKFTAKDGFGGTVTIATKENGPADHVSPASGKTIFTITRTDSLTNDPSGDVQWVFEIRRLDAASGNEYVHTQGPLVLRPRVGTSS